MDIYAYLRRDHRRVSDLMEQVLALKSPEQRPDLFRQLKHELLLHTETEQTVFYSAFDNMRQIHEKIDEAGKEHEAIKDYLVRLSLIPISSKEWLEQFGAFRHAVLWHIRKEEDEFFDQARRILSHGQAVQMAGEMQALKQKLFSNAA